MGKVLVVGDVHIADNPPGWRTADYRDHILEKLVWVGKCARENGAGVIVFTGDLFHRKSGVSHGLVSNLLDVFGRYPITPIVVPGNHDVKFDRVDDLEKTALGVLHKSNAVTCFGQNSMTAHYGKNIALVGYRANMDAEYLSKVVSNKNEHIHLAVVHYGFSKRPMPYHTIVTSECEPPRNVSMIVAGHIHDDQGEWMWGDVRVVSYGSISRGSWTTDNRTRTPRVALVDLSTNTVESINVPCHPASEVFRTEEAEEKAAKLLGMEEFVSSLDGSRVAMLSVGEVSNTIEASGVAKPVADRAIEAVEQVW